MSGNSGRKGERIGPYQLLKRYRGIGPDEGPLYEARHVETGAPALVMLPGPGEDGRPKSDWRVQAEGSTQPPYRALHVERAPRGRASALHDLTMLFIQLAGATAHVEKRRDTHAHFTRRPRFPRRQVLRWGGAGLGVAAAVALIVFLWPHAPEEMCTAFDEPIIFASKAIASSPISYPMPETPFKQQARPPCTPDAEVELRGGCWSPHARVAPCPRSTAEYQGKCYIPVKKPDPEPTSVQP